ncbi:MAG: flavodoxin family protein [Acidimicrobiia bacterium]
MHAIVVYESMFGNTRAIADQIAAGLSKHGAAQVFEVGEAPAAPVADLLVVGAPTHAFGLSKPTTRSNAADMTDHALVSPGDGAREWLAAMPEGSGQAATFGTRVSGPLGSAASAIGRRLRSKGRHLICDPEDFFVAARGVEVDEALKAGELERARAWGDRLGRLATHHSDAAV